MSNLFSLPCLVRGDGMFLQYSIRTQSSNMLMGSWCVVCGQGEHPVQRCVVSSQHGDVLHQGGRAGEAGGSGGGAGSAQGS